MQEGDSTFLDIDLGTGVRQFRLDVDRIGEVDKETSEKATTARARASVAGRALPPLGDRVRRGLAVRPGLLGEDRDADLDAEGDDRRPGRPRRLPRRRQGRPHGAQERQPPPGAAAALAGEDPVPRRPRGRQSVSFLNLRAQAGQGRDVQAVAHRLRADHPPPRPRGHRRRRAREGHAAPAAQPRERDARRGGPGPRGRDRARVVTARDLDLTDLALNPLTGTLVSAPL